MATDNKVQVVIEAKDSASEVIKKTGVSFDNLNKENITLTKSLLATGTALQTVVTYADTARSAIANIGVAIFGYGVAITGTVGGAIASLYGLTTVVGQIKSAIASPIAQNFIQGIQQQAEDATKELASVKDLLIQTSSVAGNLGAGFAQKAFNIDSRTIAQQLDEGIVLGVKNIGNKVRNPLKAALGSFSVDELSSDELDERRLNARIANASKTSGYTSANAPVGVKVFDQLDKQIALIYADRKIGEKLGQNLSNDLIKGFITNTPAKNLLSAPIQELLNGSLTNAILKIPEQRLSATLGNLFAVAGTGADRIAARVGTRLGQSLFGGLDPAIIERQKRSREILGTTFDGIGAKFTKGLGQTTFTARGTEQVDYSNISKNLFKAIGASGIPGLERLNPILGEAVAKGLGKGIDSKIPDILAPLVTGAADYVTNRFKTAGTNAIASAASSFLPGYLKGVVKSSLLESGTAGLVFDTLIENLKPSKLIANFAGLDGVLGNLKKNVNSALTSADGLLKGLQTGIATIPPFLGKIQAAIPGLFASADTALSELGFHAIELVANFNQAIFQLSGNIINSLLDASIALEDLRGKGIGDGLIDGLQAGILKAIQAVGFIQERIKAISRIGIVFTLIGIEKVRGILDGLNNFSQNIIPIIKNGIASIFLFAVSGVERVDGVIQGLLNSVFDGIEFIEAKIPDIVDGALVAIGDLKNTIAEAFGGIDSFFEDLKTSSSFGASLTPQIDFIQGAFTALGEGANSSLSSIQFKIVEAGDVLLELAPKALEAVAAISLFSSESSEKIQSGIIDAFSNIVSGIDTFAPDIFETFNGLISSAIAAVGGDGTTGFGQRFNEIVDSSRGILTAITPIFNGIVTFIQTRFGDVVNFIKILLGNAGGIVAENLGKIIGKFLAIDFSTLPPGILPILDKLFGGTFSQLFTRLGSNATRSFLGGFLGAGFDRVVPLISGVDAALIKVYSTLSTLPQKIAAPLDKLAAVPGILGGINEPLTVFAKLKDGISGVSNSIFTATQDIAFMGQGLQTLQFAGAAPFEFLIGQTVKLREQLLSTQSSLVATSKIYDGFTGKQIVDPKTAIQSLEKPIQSAIDILRFESLDLVGVTSNDLIPLYQQIAGQITAIGGTLGNAKDLSLDFAAALGTLNVPLNQSQQEIGSILMGTVDQNSILAKSLNISNEQLNNWKSQGRLVEELRNKLSPFRAGNALAAASLGGVTSNIQEVFDEIGRKAGLKLLDPLLKEITGVYDYLKVNQSQFIAYFGQISDYILRIGLAVVDSAKTVGASIGGFAAQIPLYLFESLANAIEAVANAIKFTSDVLGPAIRFVTELVQAAGPLGGYLLQWFVSLKVLSTAVTGLGDIFGTLTQLVPGLGEVLFALDLRTNGVANQFVNLTQVLGVGGGGFLILGKYLNEIPGAAEAASLALGPLGGTLVGFIPTLANIGIQVAGLIILFPVVGVFLSNLLTLAPALITAAGAFATSNIYLAPLAPLFTSVAAGATLYANASDRLLLVNQQFVGVLKNIGGAIAGQILTFGLLAGGAYLAFLAFDKFVLQNETFKEILYGTIQGLGALAGNIKIILTNPLGIAAVAVTTLAFAMKFKLIPTIYSLIATTLAGWATAIAGVLGGLATTLTALGFTGLALSASTAAIGIKALGIAMTQGTVASASFLATNGVTVSGLFGLTAAASGASTGIVALDAGLVAATAGTATFATALYTAIAPLLLLIAPFILFGAVLAGIGFAVYARELTKSREETELLAAGTERLSARAIETATALKTASNVQAEADKRGVRLSDEQYKANEKLVNQTKLRRADLEAQLVELRSQLGDAVGDAEKKRREQLITEMEARIKLLDSLVGNVKIKPIDLERLGSAYEQLANLAAAAEEALINSSGDPALFKKKAEELLSSTEKQTEAGQISASEAIRRYNLIATNAAASSELQQKAQESITKAFKTESDRRISIIQAEQAAITAQLAAGRFEYEKNSAAIADSQNSILKSRLEAEKAAHEIKLKQIQKEFDDQVFVNTSLLNQKEAAANIEAQKNADREASLQGVTQAELSRVKAAIANNNTSNNFFQRQSDAFVENQNNLKQKQVQLEKELEASKARQATQEKTAKDKPLDVDLEARKTLKDKILQIEKDKTSALYSETNRSNKIAAELAVQISKNETDAAKLGADLRLKVKTGAISQELAAERQLTFAKKTELETQLRVANDTYTENKNIIERSFATTDKFLSDKIAKKQAEATKLPAGSKERDAAEADIAFNTTKLLNASKAKNSSLILLENNHKVEVSKINSDTLKNQTDSVEKEAAIAIKILERNQKKTLDAVQQAENERLIQIQQLENKGLLDHSEVEEKKTESTKKNIATQLNEERLRLKALLALPTPKNQEKDAERNEQIRASRLKIQGFIKSSLDTELKLYKDHIAVVLGNIKDGDTVRETQLENSSRKGLIAQTEVTEELARRKLASLEKEYALETKDASKRKELALAIEKAKTAVLDAGVAVAKQRIKDEDTVRETQLENSSRKGLIAQTEVTEELARRKLASLEKEYALETKDASKRKELALAIEKAKTAVLDAGVAVAKQRIKDEDTVRETQLENSSRKGLIAQTEVTEELARRKLASLEKEYALETKDASKRKELALAIEKAKTALMDAEIKTRQEKLEVQNQKLKNQIDEQNRELKHQGDLYGILTKALEQNNKLQEVARDLAKAGTDFVTSELDILSSIESSEYRKKQLAEITASIKLRSLSLQQEFEKQSLLNQMRQNELALEQEAIQNRMAQGTKVSDIAGVKAEIAIAQADERNKTPAGRQKIAALEIKLQSELDGLGNLQDQARLIVEKGKVQQSSEKAQIAQLGMKQTLDTLKAEADYVNTLPPGKRQQGQAFLKQKFAETLGQDNIRDAYNAGIADSRKLANQRFGVPGSPDILGAINPNLGGILDAVGGRAATSAYADTQQTFNREYGSVENITGAMTTGISRTPFQLPAQVQQSLALSADISKQANQPSTSAIEGGFQSRIEKILALQPENKQINQLRSPSLPESSIRLPSPTERGSLLSLENSGMLFKAAVDKLVDYLKDQNSTVRKDGTTYNIKVDSQQKSVTDSGTGNETSLENVLKYAKQMANA